MMFRHAWLAAAAIGLLMPAFAVHAQAQAPKPTFLWEVKSPDNHTLYIFGAPGAGNGDLYPVSYWAEAAYTRSEVLAVEVDLRDEQRYRREAAPMFYAKDDSLQNHINAKLYEELADFHALKGMGMTQSDHFKPYALAFGLQSDALQSVGLNPSFDAPFYFTAKAEADNKPVVEIDGIAASIAMLEALPIPLQEELLKSAVEHAALGHWGEELQAEVTTWKSGDVDYYAELDQQSYKDMEHGADIRKRLIEDRNPAYADKLGGYLKSGKIHFAVISAQHLVGHNNLIQELIQRGFKVQRL